MSFLEKTASSIDENKSAFKASLSNITKPTQDIFGYGSQPLYGSSGSVATPAQIPKPKPKPRSRGRKTAIKPEPKTKIEPTPSPISIASHSIKPSDKFSSVGGSDDANDMRVRSTPTPWRIDEMSVASGSVQLPQAQQLLIPHGHQHSSSTLSGTQSHSTERNITIAHTDVNTTYNHTTNQTYQYSGYPSYLPSTKPESFMYSAQGTVHHPHTRAESSTTNTSTVSNSTSPHIHSAYSASHIPQSNQPATTFNQTVSNVCNISY